MVYHYTSVEVLFKILDQVIIDESNPDGNLYITLRATHANFLNDLSEGQLLPNVLKKLGVQISALNISNLLSGYPYVISFSKNADSLTMWRDYGHDGTGIALGFEQTELLDIKKTDGGDFFQKDNCDCIYVSEEQLSNLMSTDPLWLQYKSNTDDLVPLINLLQSSLKYKHEAFAYEEEYRLYTHEFFDENFYVNGSKLIPFQNVRIPIEALKEIILGPNTDKEKLQYSIQKLLAKTSNNILKYHHLDGIKIQLSTIPYISKEK